MNREDDQSLWDLLGQSPELRVSPFFARNVVRQLRQQRSLSERLGPLFNWRIAAPASVAAGIVIVSTFFLHSSPSTPVRKGLTADIKPVAAPEISKTAGQLRIGIDKIQVHPLVMAAAGTTGAKSRLVGVNEEDYEVVANLDDLMVQYETSLWDQNSSL